MTLTRLLEIHLRWVQPEALASLRLAERVWAEHDCPLAVRALVDVLETILVRCVREGIYYAPILLQRKKALERGTWAPRIASPAVPLVGREAPPLSCVASNAALSNQSTCPRCGGSGIAIAPGGASGSLCPCGAWQRVPGRSA